MRLYIVATRHFVAVDQCGMLFVVVSVVVSKLFLIEFLWVVQSVVEQSVECVSLD